MNLTLKTTTARRAFLLLDVIAGILIIAVISFILITSLHRVSQARTRLADERSAASQLEQALVDLSLGRRPDPAITVKPLSTPHWVEVSITLSNRRMTLLGVVGRPVQPEGAHP